MERLWDTASDEGKKRVDAALSATARGDNLIRQMLTFARRQVLHPEVLEVNAELRAFAPLLASALSETINLSYQLPAKPILCRIDRAEFEFAILNIATNARHAMPCGGSLEISAATVAVMDGVDLTPGRYLRIAFRDSGEGMPPEVLARAFEPYFTTRNAGVGTGLGLSQVYGFARQSEGLATVDSVVGRGTTVTMYLPVLAADTRGEDALPMQMTEGT
jgi:two-component system, NtrC family, sensor kinase